MIHRAQPARHTPPRSMAWLQLNFDAPPQDAPLLSEHLSDAGALAVTLSDAGDEPIFEPGPGATPLWRSTRVVALFEPGRAPETLLHDLRLRVAPADLPPCRVERLEDQDWERAWMSRFQPMRFGHRLWICPSWAEPPAPEAVTLRLDPGLAFGTGSHPTTALCLEWLDGADLRGCRVIDYGCGSGVLGIAALLLGAERVWAVDNDPQALTATRSNAESNAVARHLSVHLPDELPPLQADLLLANILARPLIDLAPAMARHLAPGGGLVLSGILRSQASEVTAAYAPWFPDFVRRDRDDWCCLAGSRCRGASV